MEAYLQNSKELPMDFISSTFLSLTEKPDSKKKINQIIEGYGYPYEKHYYETEDGYINLVVRISGRFLFLG